MKTVFFLLFLFSFFFVKAQNVTTIGGYTTTGSSGLICAGNPFNQVTNVNTTSLTDHATFNLLAGVGCSYYLHSTLGAPGAAGTEAGFRIAVVNLASLLSGITIQTYLAGQLQESVSGSNLLTVLEAGATNIFFTTTKAYDALRIRFSGLLSTAYSVRIYWGYGAHHMSVVLPFRFDHFDVKEKEGRPLLKWSLGEGERGKLVVVERSLDGRSFEPLAELLAGKSFSYLENRQGLVSPGT